LSGETLLIISGSGKMKNFQPDDNDHLPNNYVVNVEIKEGVTSIGNRAFANSYQLQSVAIPSSVTHIGEYAFSGIARTFTAIVIPDGVTSIGRGAFISTYLETVTIGENVTDIGNEAFYNSIHIRSVINRSSAPQVINRDYTFSSVRNAKLYVPKEAIDKYRNSSWNIFGEILPIEE
jgi:hypothetical protein